jgi:O-antigen/teichoic acid export membrane protein
MADEAVEIAFATPPDTSNAAYTLEAMRVRRFRLAVATSVGAKMAALALQFAAIPVALHVLGPASFGLFVTISSLVSWMGLTSVGIGPGLTLGIARAVAKPDIEGERAYFWTSVGLMTAISTLLALAVTGAFLVVPARSLTGVADPLMARDATTSLVIIGLLSAAQLCLSVVDAARLGYQELHISNLWTLISTGVSFIALLELRSVSPTVAFLIVALNAPPVVVRVFNGGFLLRAHPNLRAGRLVFKVALVRQILLVGVGFAAVSLASFLSQQVGLVLLAQRQGPEAVAAPGTMLRLIMLASSAVAMLTQPLWPALADATARADTRWARSAFRRVLGLSLAYSAAVCVALLFFGQQLVHIWTGGALRVDQTMMLLFALYFPLGVWSHVHAMTLVGLGKIRVAAAVLLVEGIIGVVVAMVAIPMLGGTAIPLALLGSTAAVSGWVLPLVVARNFAVARASTAEPRTPAL